MIKRILSVVLSLILILSPTVFAVLFAIFSPEQFSNSFVGVLDEKYELLGSIEEDKIVVVGGSSVAFGLDSYKLEEYTGMPVVNFGLYAALGTKLMLDLSLSGIKDGDIVIISPEIDKQTLSLYFNADTTLRAIDGNFSMMFDIDVDNWPSLIGSMWGFAVDKWSAMMGDGKKNTDGEIYLSKYFNEKGDFALYERKENIMQTYYDPNNTIYLDKSAYGSDFDEFAGYLNDYISKCEKRGATVYFAYPPMNEKAIDESSTDQVIYEFNEHLKNSINCEFLGSPNDSILEAGYFFDTNFHLNDSGAFLRTLRLGKALRLKEGISNGIIYDKEPEAPALPGKDVKYEGFDENSVYFTYTLMENGAYAITGLSDEGKSKTSLTVPLGVDGKKVMSIYEGAFRGSVLTSLTVTEDSNLVRFENGAFAGASNLRDLWIYKTTGDDISPPVDFIGVNQAFRVHVPAGTNYDTHYYWGDRKLVFVFDANEDRTDNK